VSGSERLGRLRVSRGLAALRLAARGGVRYATSAPRLFATAGDQREQLRNDLALRTAEDVASTLGTMKGVLMKLGQMASYVDDGLAPPVRRTLSTLQDSVPPMSSQLAAQVIEEELGGPPDQVFDTWDPEPIAAASIGQVHRAITKDRRAVAVKVQYPGIAQTIAADLGNVGLLRSLLRVAAPSQDVNALIEELRERITEELDYLHEAENQRTFAAYFDGHPTITVPKIVDELSTARVITSELATGARWAELLAWPQAEKDLAAETIYRFTFRSLYEMHAFNGDPHPGNYLFRPGGHVTFLDFGLVKYFTEEELKPLVHMVRYLCVDNDPAAFRKAMEDADFLTPGAPIPTEQVIEHMALFYDTVRTPGTRTMTPGYASAVARRYFDFHNPLAAYARIPKSYVILQRINLGMFALLGDLAATADWRAIAEEIWPFVQAPPSTPMGAEEVAWRASRAAVLPSAGTAAAAVGRDVDPVRAGQAAEPAGPVLRQVDHHVVAVGRRADQQARELAGPDDVGEGHRRVHRHPVGERRFRRRGVDVVVPAVVLEQLRQRPGVPQQRVDKVGGLVLGHFPQPREARPEPPDLLEFLLVVRAAAGPPPVLDERVESGHVRQLFPAAAPCVDQRGGSVQ